MHALVLLTRTYLGEEVELGDVDGSASVRVQVLEDVLYLAAGHAGKTLGGVQRLILGEHAQRGRRGRDNNRRGHPPADIRASTGMVSPLGLYERASGGGEAGGGYAEVVCADHDEEL